MVLLKDFDVIDNGAQFLSADLHIHTYGGSQDVSDTGFTPQAIVESAVKQGISVIAITDHNSDINVQIAVDYARDNYTSKILVLKGLLK